MQDKCGRYTLLWVGWEFMAWTDLPNFTCFCFVALHFNIGVTAQNTPKRVGLFISSADEERQDWSHLVSDFCSFICFERKISYFVCPGSTWASSLGMFYVQIDLNTLSKHVTCIPYIIYSDEGCMSRSTLSSPRAGFTSASWFQWVGRFLEITFC